MTVRRAAGKDVGALVELHEEVHAIHLAARPDQFKSAAEGALAARFLELLSSAGVKVWVAELEGAVIGYAVQILMHRAELLVVRERSWWDIDTIVVADAHRRKGIGRDLIETIIADVRESPVRQLELSSWAFNTEAHRAFEHAGFVPKLLRFELRR